MQCSETGSDRLQIADTLAILSAPVPAPDDGSGTKPVPGPPNHHKPGPAPHACPKKDPPGPPKVNPNAYACRQKNENHGPVPPLATRPGIRIHVRSFLKGIISLFILLLLVLPAGGCSVVLLADGNTSLVGRNFDWISDYASVRADSPGAEKTALYVNSSLPPAHWTTKYRTLTIDGGLIITGDYGNLTTQTDGMNDQGLYAGGLWIHPPPDVKYPDPDGRPELTPPMVVPYLLDNYATVNEAVAGFQGVQVTTLVTDATLITNHWFIADRSGDSAIIEFPNGNLTIIHPVQPPVMTNHFKTWGDEASRDYTGHGGALPIPYGEKPTTLNRSLMAGAMVGQYTNDRNLTAPAAFSILDTVSQHTSDQARYTSATPTQWSVVYDLKNRTMEWQVHDNATHFLVAMDRVPFCNGSAVRTIPLHPGPAGDVSGLVPSCAGTAPGPTVPAPPAKTPLSPVTVIAVLLGLPVLRQYAAGNR